MNKVYGCLFMVLLLCLATTADLLAYLTVGGTFFVIGAFVLGGLLLLSVFLYGTRIAKLFSLALFGITLLTGVILFSRLMPANELVFALLIVSGLFGFVCTLLCSSCSKTCKKMCSENMCSDSACNADMPPMPMTETQMPMKKGNKENGKSIRVSTYNMENPEASSLATMEALEELSDNDSDDDFVNLKDLENMMEKKKTARKTAPKRKKR